MKLAIRDELLYASISIAYQGKTLVVENVLVDSGSVTTVLQADLMAGIGIVPDARDRLRSMWGIGGSEPVFRRQVDSIIIGSTMLPRWTIDVAGMDYGYELHGILGTDVLLELGATLDFRGLILVIAGQS